MKKILSLVLALVMILGLAACNKTPDPDPSQPAGSQGESQPGSEAPKPTEKPKTYVEEISVSMTAPDTRDPMRIMNQASDTCFKMIYNQLVFWNFDTNQLEGELASSWEISSDGLEYTFHLRDDVTFSNGQPFEADDVVYTFKDRAGEVITSGGSYQIGDLMNILADIVAVDQHTVKMTLSEPNADIIIRLFLQPYSIYNREACEADPDNGYLIGTNGWVWAEFTPAESASFTKYENSWVWKDHPTHTKKVNFKKYLEVGSRAAALEAGEIVAAGLDSINASILPEGKFKTDTFAAETLCYAFFNMKRGIAKDDVNLRKAIAHAYDRNDVNDAVYEGDATLTNTLWGKSQFGLYNDVEDKLEYDPDLARDYLKKSSHPDGNFTFVLWCHNKWDDAGIVMQDQIMKTLGCKVELVSVDTSRLNAAVKRIMNNEDIPEDYYDMCVYNISLNPTGNRFAYTTNLKSTTNRAFFYNAEMDELYKKAVTLTDDKERSEVYKRIQIIMNEELAYVPWMYEAASMSYDVRVTGVIWSPDTKFDYSHIEMTNEY
jgi:peptide/nickel transport system substrate-binding protein